MKNFFVEGWYMASGVCERLFLMFACRDQRFFRNRRLLILRRLFSTGSTAHWANAKVIEEFLPNAETDPSRRNSIVLKVVIASVRVMSSRHCGENSNRTHSWYPL